MPRLTRAQLEAEVEALRASLAKETARRKRLERQLRVRGTELSESFAQQTATSEVLRVISSSPSDIQPVLDVVAENAARLCEALDAEIFRREDDHLVLAAHYGRTPVGTVGEFAVPLVRQTINGRCVLDGRTIHVADLQVLADDFPRGSELARQQDSRAHLSIPLMRAGIAIGLISLRRTEANLFTERQVALLQTFAEQAVIAIENVRLFRELGARNAELTESLAQQTATSEVLGVISRSPTDIQPVLDTVAESAARLCNAFDAAIFRRDGGRLVLVAHHGPIHPGGSLGVFTLPLVRGSFSGRAVLEGATVHVLHAQDQSEEYPEGSELARRIGFETALIVPLMREGVAIGSISLRRTEARPFTKRQVALLQTFADQ